MKKMLMTLLLFCLFLTSFAFGAGSQEAAEPGGKDESAAMPYKGQTLTVSMWGYNMDKLEANIIQPFEKKYGVDVVVETGNNSDRFTKMMARKDNPQVDVALFAGAWAYKAMKEGIIKPYDPAKIKNLDSLIEACKDPLGGHYAIAYTINHLGIFYRTDKVKEITSWKDLAGKELAGYLTIPHISTTFGPAIIYMLSKTYGTGVEDTEAGWAALKALKPNLLTAYSKSSELNTLILQEEVYAAPYTSFSWGSIKGSGLPVAAALPKEGLVGSYSLVCLGAGTKNEDLANLYIDNLLSYDVQMAEAMDLIDSPARMDIKLPPEIGENLTYGDELISKLTFFSQKEMAENQEAWIKRWNTIFTE